MEIQKVISQLKDERRRIDRAIQVLKSLAAEGKPRSSNPKQVSGSTSNVISAKITPITHGRRNLSPAARRRISEAQKRRWAASRRIV
jgi:hypothetical protein